MKKLSGLLMGLTMLAAIPAVCFGQDGLDISTAIPIYFGQTINDQLDAKTRQHQVYSIALGKGQQFSVTATGSGPNLAMVLGDSTVTTIAIGPWLKNTGCCAAAVSITYQAAASGVYFIEVATNGNGITYKLVVTSTGPIVPTGSCSVSSTTAGPVTKITYSLGLIAAGLPDSAIIGGQTLCATCALKPPAYPELVNKIEKAMGLGLNISAGFDSNGNMCQIALVHP